VQFLQESRYMLLFI